MRSTRATLRALRLAMAGLAVATAGCYTVTPFGSINTIATGGQNFAIGRGSQVYPASDNFLEQASKALDDLNVASVSRTRDRETVVFQGVDTKGRRATVHVTPVSDGAKMRVDARFGVFGDEALSRAYLDRLAVRTGPIEGEKPRADASEASPPLKLNAHGADLPRPGPSSSAGSKRASASGRTPNRDPLLPSCFPPSALCLLPVLKERRQRAKGGRQRDPGMRIVPFETTRPGRPCPGRVALGGSSRVDDRR